MPDDRQLEADPAHRVEQLARGEPARLRGAGARARGPGRRRRCRRRGTRRRSRRWRSPNASVRHSSRPRVHDLGHLVASASPARPSSPASPAAASSRAARSAGTGRRAPRRTRSAGASAGRARYSEPNSMSPVSACASKWIIETRPWPSVLGHARGVRAGDRVVAAEDHRDRARRAPPSRPRPRARAASARCRRSTSRRRRRRRRRRSVQRRRRAAPGCGRDPSCGR